MYVAPSPPESFDKYDEPRLHMERLLCTRLIEFDLPPRSVFPLDDAGIRTLGDLIGHTREELLAVRGFGAIRLAPVEQLLDRLALSLKK